MRSTPATSRPAPLPVCALLLCLAGVAAAEAPPDSAALAPAVWSAVDSVYVLPPILVMGDPVVRHALRERESLATSVVFPAASPHRQATVASLLRELPGLEVRRQGGLGAFSTAHLRGSGGQEVAVFLDGVDLRHPFTGLALLDELPLAGVERVEVFRGGVPAELGGGAPAGAVHVVTGEAGADRVALGLGSYGTRRVSAALAGGGPWRLRWSVAGAWLGSEADFTYLDRRGTTVSNTADDTLRVRENADFTGGDLLARLRWEAPGGGLPGALAASYRYLRRENGVPGTETLPSYHTRSLRSGHDGRLAWTSPVLAGRLRLRLQGYLQDGTARFLNPEKETTTALSRDETRDRLRARGLQGHADLYLLPLHLLLRAEARRDRFLPEVLNPDKPPEYERRRRLDRAEAEARLALARLFLAAAYGEERIRDNYFGPAGPPWLPAEPQPEHRTRERFRRAGLRLGAVEREGPAGSFRLDLLANAGDGYRAPTLLELFGQDVAVKGNPELAPETGVQTDAGLSLAWHRGGLTADLAATWFRRDREDQILFTRNSQYAVRALNISASRVTGRELDLRLAWRGATLSLARTDQAARDRSGLDPYDGKCLPYASPARLFARLGAARGPWEAFAEVDWRSRVYTDRYNDPDRSLPAARVWSAGLGRRLPRGLRLTLEGINLDGARVEDMLGYPLPGRTWLLTLEWEGRAGLAP
ncbi:MAG: TonB-dependent receptor [Candidatus Krumholzibacteriota bacterium]|nr:TonB-dependent receptor [Candidatus Krumholzibacteriota bacterium]